VPGFRLQKQAYLNSQHVCEFRIIVSSLGEVTWRGSVGCKDREVYPEGAGVNSTAIMTLGLEVNSISRRCVLGYAILFSWRGWEYVGLRVVCSMFLMAREWVPWIVVYPSQGRSTRGYEL